MAYARWQSIVDKDPDCDYKLHIKNSFIQYDEPHCIKSVDDINVRYGIYHSLNKKKLKIQQTKLYKILSTIFKFYNYAQTQLDIVIIDQVIFEVCRNFHSICLLILEDSGCVDRNKQNKFISFMLRRTMRRIKHLPNVWRNFAHIKKKKSLST